MVSCRRHCGQRVDEPLRPLVRDLRARARRRPARHRHHPIRIGASQPIRHRTEGPVGRAVWRTRIERGGREPRPLSRPVTTERRARRTPARPPTGVAARGPRCRRHPLPTLTRAPPAHLLQRGSRVGSHAPWIVMRRGEEYARAAASSRAPAWIGRQRATAGVPRVARHVPLGNVRTLGFPRGNCSGPGRGVLSRTVVA
jgi:hypothetical protein